MKLLYLLLFVSVSPFVLAQSVTLDTAFGTGGRVINNTITSGQAIQLQGDGKIVSCYLSDFSIAGNVNLVRFNIDGSIDNTFGNNGFVNTTVVNESGGINMMKIQSDGKILITGTFSSNGTANGSYFDFCTARFNPDGSIDTAFGTNGYVRTGFQDLSFDTSTAIEIQNDGKILIGGYSSASYLVSENYSFDFAVIRYLSDGTIDTSFGLNGRFLHNFGNCTVPLSSTFSTDYVTAIKINTADKIIIAGITNVNESLEDYDNFGFICLNPNGTLDTSFGTEGQKVVDFGAKDYFWNLKLTNDDKIIATGSYGYTTIDGSYAKIAIVKLLENGNFDSSFGNNGIVLANRDSSNLLDTASDLVIQPDGKIICFGTTAQDAAGLIGNLLLIRFNADGTIDSTFNNVGYKVVDFDNSSVSGNSFVIQEDGKLVCAGSIDYSIGCLARLEVNSLSTNTFESTPFSIYPNPFTNKINLSLNLDQSETLSANLFDCNGRKIQNIIQDKSFPFGKSTFEIQMPESLANGIYFVSVFNGTKNTTLKIIK